MQKEHREVEKLNINFIYSGHPVPSIRFQILHRSSIPLKTKFRREKNSDDTD